MEAARVFGLVNTPVRDEDFDGTEFIPEGLTVKDLIERGVLPAPPTEVL